jgi:hypothetical protein
LDLTGATLPDSGYRSAGEVFVDPKIAFDLVERAESEGIAVLGMEGFLIDESSGEIYPSLEGTGNRQTQITDWEPQASNRHFFAGDLLNEVNLIAGWCDLYV